MDWEVSRSISGCQVSEPGWRIASTGRNWRWRCGWLAPLSSPELKKAKRLWLCPRPWLLEPFVWPDPDGFHAFRTSYVASRSALSSRSVCACQSLVTRRK